MTTHRLRDLLDDRVADIDVPDLAGPAWDRANGVRRRRRTVVVGVAAAAVLAVAGTIALVDPRSSTEPSPSGRPTPTAPTSTPAPDLPPRAMLAGTFRRVPFWWAPPAPADDELPVLQVTWLPDLLSMADEAPVTTPPDHVQAVFGTGRQQYRLLSDGVLVSVDLSDRLGPVGDEGGNQFDPLGARAVSPDGTQVIFRQPGRLDIWDLPSNSWRAVQTPDYEQAAWTRSGELWLPGDGETGRPDIWSGDEQHQYSGIVSGPAGSAELDWQGMVQVPTTGDLDQVGNPEILVAGPQGHAAILAVGSMGRSKICCSVIGWFSHDFVLYTVWTEDGPRVHAWRVGTPDVYRVSRIVDPPRTFVASSWAEDAFTDAP
jgi:hypothetical protein